MASIQTPTPINKNRRSQASRAADQAAAKPTETPTTTPPAAAPTPSPKPEHEVKIDIGLTSMPVWKPIAVVDGQTWSCPHQKYGHEGEASAKRCINKIVREATAS
jgi:hypothetical protein